MSNVICNEKIIALAGNPNVGKSTIFNYLTGLKQHTGNWAGKTVGNTIGRYKDYLIADIPGTYSLFSNSPEEEIARNFLCFEKVDYCIVVCDATNLERNLYLALQIAELIPKTAICLNMLDEANNNGIIIDTKRLEKLMGIPVYEVIGRKGYGIHEMIEKLEYSDFKSQNIRYNHKIEEACEKVKKLLPDININKRWLSLRILEQNKDFLNSLVKQTNYNPYKNSDIQEIACNLADDYDKTEKISEAIISDIYENSNRITSQVLKTKEKAYAKQNILDKIFTGRYTAVPCMIIFLGLIIWLTVKGANYPSQLLTLFFDKFEFYIRYLFSQIGMPILLQSFLLDGIYKITTWVIAVMLPPMAIFFPLFTLLEDFGYLPRIAFNLDKCFACSNSCGKQALTTCMGFGCNAVGVTGCRIINSKRERLIAILTNSFVPCNGRFPSIILIITIFFCGISKHSQLLSSFYMVIVVCIGIMMTFVTSYILSKTLLKGTPSSLILELPPYRRPQLYRILIHSLVNRTLEVLLRAVYVAIPCGAVIWILTNTHINNLSTITYLTNFFEPLGLLMGLDGIIICAFILGLPANEIVLPLVIMLYSNLGTISDTGAISETTNILISNGWTVKTAICYIIFTLFHWPCSTTLLTIKKETNSLYWTFLSLIIPTIIGVLCCILLNLLL